MPRGYDQNRFEARFQENRYFEQATRRDLMPGHVHTLGILKHSRSTRQALKFQEATLEYPGLGTTGREVVAVEVGLRTMIVF